MRSIREVEAVRALIEAGWNDCEINRRTGIPRSTVREWRHGRTRGTRAPRPSTCAVCNGSPERLGSAYAYLLGLYLGDGTISHMGRGVFRLRVFMDRRYPRIIEACDRAMRATLPNRTARTEHRDASHPDGGMVEVSSYSKHWPCLFPQHGPGRKHERTIALAGWQQEIARRWSEQLVCGLIHSDGCRSVNRVKGGRYAYARYFFSNRSADILTIFAASLDRIGVGWTRTRPDCISIARAADVARLDAFVGPKR